MPDKNEEVEELYFSDQILIKAIMIRMEEYGMPSYSLKDNIPALDILQIIKDAGYSKLTSYIQSELLHLKNKIAEYEGRKYLVAFDDKEVFDFLKSLNSSGKVNAKFKTQIDSVYPLKGKAWVQINEESTEFIARMICSKFGTPTAMPELPTQGELNHILDSYIYEQHRQHAIDEIMNLLKSKGFDGKG